MPQQQNQQNPQQPQPAQAPQAQPSQPAQPAQPPPEANVQTSSGGEVAGGGGKKKSTTLIILVIVGVLVLGALGFGVWKIFLTNHTERYNEAEDSISTQWNSFLGGMFIQMWGGGVTEEEVMEDYEEMITEAQGELKGVYCWRVKGNEGEDCKNLKKYLREAKDLAEDVRKIYEKEQEEDKADVLEEKEDQLSDYNSDISAILND